MTIAFGLVHGLGFANLLIGGSTLIAALACIWLLERSLQLDLSSLYAAMQP